MKQVEKTIQELAAELKESQVKTQEILSGLLEMESHIEQLSESLMQNCDSEKAMELAQESLWQLIETQSQLHKGTDVLKFAYKILNFYDPDELMETKEDMINYIKDVTSEFLDEMY